MYRESVVERDAYTCDLQEVEGVLFLHLDVHEYSKEIHEQMMEDWNDVQEALYYEGYERVFAIPEKLGLVSKLGWTHFMDVDIDGQTRGMYVWDLPCQSSQ